MPQPPTPHAPIDQSSNLARYSHTNARPVSREPYEPSNARYLHPTPGKKAVQLNPRTSSHELSKQPQPPNPRYGSEMKTLNNYFNKSSTPNEYAHKYSQKKPKYELRLNLHSQNGYHPLEPYDRKPREALQNPVNELKKNSEDISPGQMGKGKDDLSCSPFLSSSNNKTYPDGFGGNNNSYQQSETDSLYKKGLINPTALKHNYLLTPSSTSMVRQKIHEGNYGAKKDVENLTLGQGSPVNKPGTFYMGGIGPDIRDMTISGSKDTGYSTKMSVGTHSTMRNNFLRDIDVRNEKQPLVVGGPGARLGSQKVGDFKMNNNKVSNPQIDTPNSGNNYDRVGALKYKGLSGQNVGGNNGREYFESNGSPISGKVEAYEKGTTSEILSSTSKRQDEANLESSLKQFNQRLNDLEKKLSNLELPSDKDRDGQRNGSGKDRGSPLPLSHYDIMHDSNIYSEKIGSPLMGNNNVTPKPRPRILESSKPANDDPVIDSTGSRANTNHITANLRDKVENFERQIEEHISSKAGRPNLSDASPETKGDPRAKGAKFLNTLGSPNDQQDSNAYTSLNSMAYIVSTSSINMGVDGGPNAQHGGQNFDGPKEESEMAYSKNRQRLLEKNQNLRGIPSAYEEANLRASTQNVNSKYHINASLNDSNLKLADKDLSNDKMVTNSLQTNTDKRFYENYLNIKDLQQFNDEKLTNLKAKMQEYFVVGGQRTSDSKFLGADSSDRGQGSKIMDLEGNDTIQSIKVGEIATLGSGDKRLTAADDGNPKPRQSYQYNFDDNGKLRKIFKERESTADVKRLFMNEDISYFKNKGLYRTPGTHSQKAMTEDTSSAVGERNSYNFEYTRGANPRSPNEPDLEQSL